jgi:hypothetical protein
LCLAFCLLWLAEAASVRSLESAASPIPGQAGSRSACHVADRGYCDSCDDRDRFDRCAGVRGSADFSVAGRSLPTYMTLTTVFATRDGAEAVLSISVTAARDGLIRDSGRSLWCEHVSAAGGCCSLRSTFIG